MGIYSQKETYLIETDKTEDLEARILQHREKIKNKIDQALISFAKQFNIIIPFEMAEWVRYEDWIRGEEYIDKLPEDLIVYDNIFKKVYGTGIEFITTKKKEEPVTHLINYIKTRALEDIAPEVAKEIRIVRNTMKEVYKDVGSMVTGMRPTLLQITNLNKGFTDINIRLSRLDQQQKDTQTTRQKSVSEPRKCVKCNDLIFFKKNSTGKYIPFNVSDNKCHFEVCTLRPKPTIMNQKLSKYNA